MSVFFSSIVISRAGEKIYFIRIRREFSVFIFHRYVERFSRGSQARVRWRIKCRYIKILFRRESANIDARELKFASTAKLAKYFRS